MTVATTRIFASHSGHRRESNPNVVCRSAQSTRDDEAKSAPMRLQVWTVMVVGSRSAIAVWHVPAEGGVVDDAVVMDTGFVTFAHDPPEARAWPSSRAGSQARSSRSAVEVRTEQPFVGAGLVSIGIAGAWFGPLDSLVAVARWRR